MSGLIKGIGIFILILIVLAVVLCVGAGLVQSVGSQACQIEGDNFGRAYSYTIDSGCMFQADDGTWQPASDFGG